MTFTTNVCFAVPGGRLLLLDVGDSMLWGSRYRESQKEKDAITWKQELRKETLSVWVVSCSETRFLQ